MALNTVSSDRLATNVKNTNFTAAEKQDLTDDILPLAGQIGGRNLLINGDMLISQRFGSTSKALTNAKYSLDRWQVVNDAGGSKFTTQQVDDAPVGLKKSLKMTSSSAYSVPADEVYGVGQKIEGLNTNQLMFGSSDAKSITISFFVKSSLTGTFNGSVLNQDMTRGYPWTYTISAANTWEYKTVTVAGSTDGTWLHDHREGMRIFWNMGSGTNRSGTAGQWSTSQYTFGATGATSVVGTNGATLQITGCQVEEGSIATSFEHLSTATQLLRCQRYFLQDFAPQIGTMYEAWSAPNGKFATFNFPVTMRVAATVNTTNGTDGVVNSQFDNGSGGAVSVAKYSSVTSAYFYNASSQFHLAGGTVGSPAASYSSEL